MKDEEDTKKRMINLFQALSSETRLSIIYLLEKKNYYTKELSQILKITAAAVSDHLRILKNLGIVWFKVSQNKKIYYLKRKDILELINKAEVLLKRKV